MDGHEGKIIDGQGCLVVEQIAEGGGGFSFTIHLQADRHFLEML